MRKVLKNIIMDNSIINLTKLKNKNKENLESSVILKEKINNKEVNNRIKKEIQDDKNKTRNNPNLIRFKVITFGCKTNQSESDEIIRGLLSYGFKLVESDEKFDFIIINTCTVTSMADKKVRQFLRSIKQSNPDAKIIVTGCFVKFNDEFLKNEGIDNVFLNENKDEIVNFLKNKYINKINNDFYNLKSKNLNENVKNQLNLIGKHTREFIKIQDGCEQGCSYCIIPYVRNKYKSEDPKKVIFDIEQSIKAGIEEIVLTGIHIGKYGVDFKANDEIAIDNIKYSDLNLKLLIEIILKNTNIKRIRLSSIEINEIDEDFLFLIKDNNRIAKHLHIPLQSASNKILKSMKRPYDKDTFYNKISKIKEIIPDITLTTDIIVGFPSEDEEDFKETLNAVKDINFSKVHVFKYSKRKFTLAAQMDFQVSEQIKNERSFKLRELASQLRTNFISSNIGKILEVAIENVNYSKGYLSGMSENYIKVYIPIENLKDNFNLKIGKIFKVKAVNFYLDGLLGNIS